MNTLQIILQVLIALGIANVWLVRKDNATAYRGGAAKNMKEEFAAYGLSESFMQMIGIAKLSIAALLIVGIFVPMLRLPAGAAMAALMVGAVAMHIKVKDPISRSVPALSMLAMSLGVVILSVI